MPFDLSMTKLLILGVLAMLIFGPEKLPQLARDAGRTLRQFRAFAQQARNDLKSELGDSVGDFDFTDLNPRTFVRKHLLEESYGDVAAPAAVAATATLPESSYPETPRLAQLPPGEPAPFDADAT